MYKDLFTESDMEENVASMLPTPGSGSGEMPNVLDDIAEDEEQIAHMPGYKDEGVKDVGNAVVDKFDQACGFINDKSAKITAMGLMNKAQHYKHKMDVSDSESMKSSYRNKYENAMNEYNNYVKSNNIPVKESEDEPIVDNNTSDKNDDGSKYNKNDLNQEKINDVRNESMIKTKMSQLERLRRREKETKSDVLKAVYSKQIKKAEEELDSLKQKVNNNLEEERKSADDEAQNTNPDDTNNSDKTDSSSDTGKDETNASDKDDKVEDSNDTSDDNNSDNNSGTEPSVATKEESVMSQYFNELDSLFVEKADISPEMKPIIDKLNSKGYKTSYSSPGYPLERSKRDVDKDGILNGKMYSTARIQFNGDYKFPAPPECWEWKTVDKNDYLDVKEPSESKDDVDIDFKKYKSKYMASLTDWVENLPSVGAQHTDASDGTKKGPALTPREQTESSADYLDDIIEDLVSESVLDLSTFGSFESADIMISNNHSDPPEASSSDVEEDSDDDYEDNYNDDKMNDFMDSLIGKTINSIGDNSSTIHSSEYGCYNKINRSFDNLANKIDEGMLKLTGSSKARMGEQFIGSALLKLQSASSTDMQYTYDVDMLISIDRALFESIERILNCINRSVYLVGSYADDDYDENCCTDDINALIQNANHKLHIRSEILEDKIPTQVSTVSNYLKHVIPTYISDRIYTLSGKLHSVMNTMKSDIDSGEFSTAIRDIDSYIYQISEAINVCIKILFEIKKSSVKVAKSILNED